jgi:multiple sugar transport system permease protein
MQPTLDTEPSTTPALRGSQGPAATENVRIAALIVPAAAVVVILQVFPLGYSAYIAFQDWSLTRSDAPLGFVGFDNFERILADRIFWVSARNSAIITTVSVSIQLVLGIALAYLTIGSKWTMRAARTALIIPMVIAPIAAGTLWRMLLNSRAGPINHILSSVGISGPDWLAQGSTAVAALIVIEVWQWTPFVVLVIAAGLSSLPSDTAEAAEIDGASGIQRFWHIDLPLLAPLIYLVLMFRTLESLISLDTVYSLNFGGPGFSTYTLPFYIYSQALRNFNMGPASAAAWLFMVLAAAAITYFYRKALRAEV